MQHYGLEIQGDVDELRRLYAMLLSKGGVEVVKTTDHRVGIGLYFEDPDGNRFEFFSETIADDARGGNACLASTTRQAHPSTSNRSTTADHLTSEGSKDRAQ